MAVYKAPLNDMHFLLNEVFDVKTHLSQLESSGDIDTDIVEAILEESGKISENLLLPLNAIGDELGCQHNGDEVKTPEGFKEAFKTFCEAGWTSIGGAQEFGGQGLPKMVQVLVEEMFYSTNTSFFLYSSLSNGAYQALSEHGTDSLKQLVLPKLMDGTWSGTMCLTESHAGTDLGLMKTKAEPTGNDTYKITGSKIFITGGEHDLTDNIVHLVLAKLPDAPAGSRGISLFLVPKFKFAENGKLGERNPIFCGSIEKKMGIKGSATCVMNMDEAEGYLIGEPHQGLKCMFTMMNTERLSIGLQGVGSSEISYQSAVAYAKDRLQGKGVQPKSSGAEPIIVHPDVRRMLLTMRAYNEAMRAFAVWAGAYIDKDHYGTDEAGKAHANAMVSFLTPIAKAFFTDIGFEMSNEGLQVFGGHGYISEWGMEQLVRDARIAQIYEGTNGIQALDLVGRKLVFNQGAVFEQYAGEVKNFIEQNQSNKAIENILNQLTSNLKLVEETTQHILSVSAKDKNEIGAASVDYLRLVGLNICAYMWARMMLATTQETKLQTEDFYKAKAITADFFFKRVLPESLGLSEKVKAGAESIMALDEALF
ncbi:MAG: acyl-CoA dehydrogenase C-terminal domain-containing protein [Pseudomonadota bacterium]